MHYLNRLLGRCKNHIENKHPKPGTAKQLDLTVEPEELKTMGAYRKKCLI